MLAIVLSIGATAALLDLTTEGDVTSNPESEQGYAAIVRHFPPDPEAEFVNELILVRSDQLTVDDPPFRRKVEDLFGAVQASGAARNVSSFYESDDATLVAPGRHATLIPVGLMGDCEESAGRLVQIVQAADGGAFDATITGECTVDRDVNEILGNDLKTGELYFGLPAALVVLVLVFGALLAAVVPLVLAIFSIAVALGVASIIGLAFDLSVYLFNMLTVMGLAIGGRLLLIPDSVLRSLGVGAIAVALVSVVAALTLLPALLSLLGDRVNALRIPILGRSVESVGREGRFWSAIARAVMRRPVVSLVVTVALLLAAAAPVLDLRLSTSGIRALPEGFPSREGFAALEEEFGIGTVDSVLVTVEGDVTREPVRGAVDALVRQLEDNAVLRNPDVETSPDGNLALVEAFVVGDSRDQRVLEAVERIRSRDVPAAFGGVDAAVLVTGETAEEIDYRALSGRWLPRILVFVLALSFVLLTIAFRSIVLPLKAILLNLLSVGAAYGLMVLVFQKGIGNELFGLREVEAVTPWVPLFLFSVLFGLSMDYHVFLLSRIRERFLQTGDNTEAVAHAVATTARVITGAALIIIAVFAGFASGDLVETQQVGFGGGVALLIDATLVRSVLVPASMKLLGRWNWYLPSWLGWLPDPHVEHESA